MEITSVQHKHNVSLEETETVAVYINDVKVKEYQVQVGNQAHVVFAYQESIVVEVPP
jgi:hypothetical protein